MRALTRGSHSWSFTMRAVTNPITSPSSMAHPGGYPLGWLLYLFARWRTAAKEKILRAGMHEQDACMQIEAGCPHLLPCAPLFLPHAPVLMPRDSLEK